MIHNKKYKLAQFVLKKYEPKLQLYFFFNLKSDSFWNTNYLIGSVVASLDGSATTESIITELCNNNPDVDKKQIEKCFLDIFKFLVKEGFICE